MKKKKRAVNSRLTYVEQAGYEWWISHRPIGWTLTDHITNPTINTSTASEKALARSIASLWLGRKEPEVARAARRGR